MAVPDQPCASVVIPAHNEAAVLPRLLHALSDDHTVRLEIVVVANGCTDRTVDVARSAAPTSTVIELTEPSKRLALERGDAAASAFPRLYVDADVELTTHSVQLLADAVRDEHVLAAAPARIIPRHELNRLVRWYYDVWEALPQVRSGLFGRGVVALSETGNRRVRALPPMMGDDLIASEAFGSEERVVVADAHVVVHGPRTLRDLYRRRVRAVTGNAQADEAGLRSGAATTSTRTLLHVAREQPSLIGKIPLFVGVAVAARLGAQRALRRGDYDTWLRDDSSRR